MTLNTYTTLLIIITTMSVIAVWKPVFAQAHRAANLLHYVVLAIFAGLITTSLFWSSWELPVTAAVAAIAAYWAVQSGRFGHIDTTKIALFMAGGVFAGYGLHTILSLVTNGWGTVASMVFVVVVCALLAQGKIDKITIPSITPSQDKKRETKHTATVSKARTIHSNDEPTGFRLLTVRNAAIALTLCAVGFLYFGFKDAGTASTGGVFGYGSQTYECGSVLSPKSYKGNALDFTGGVDTINDTCAKQRGASLPFAVVFGIAGLGLAWLLRLLWRQTGTDQFIARLKDGR